MLPVALPVLAVAPAVPVLATAVKTLLLLLLLLLPLDEELLCMAHTRTITDISTTAVQSHSQYWRRATGSKATDNRDGGVAEEKQGMS
eukprot:COSAG05_NODE_9100_length_647_cov_1.363139_1_plen_88_part_00